MYWEQHLPSECNQPVLLIVRDQTEWPSDEFVTLFKEEGYDTRDIDASSTSTPPNFNFDMHPDGAIGTSELVH